MKIPRVKDFDPHAKEESALKSPFDHMPAIQKPTLAERGATTQAPDEATERPPDEQTARRGDRATGRGVLVRRGFEWREDQLRALKKLSLQEQLEGKPGSMSQMVRDALDDYLKQRTET